MGQRDPRIDAYIAKSAAFAQPVLSHLREVVHATCPEVFETLKWSMPYFEYKGMLCGMAAFKQHCSFGFWLDEKVVTTPSETKAMGQFGRLADLSDLPSDKVLATLIRRAMKLNDNGVKRSAVTKERPAKAPLEVPPELARALAENARARATFDGFSPSHRREYIEWLVEAKTDATRDKRLAQTLEWLAEGKSRHWKYARC
ncbi:YdeI/OmpD-associated family protein [Tahibacter amnicola]|uniref:YdeI/OmpD-associated family protein n=1 Tax=Tahibacter amnicola TaxID=2976241 RepID=A0ABY6B9Z0_9GAMM|nr:YdeI/OmpD-associated family protein [Tahibacter amnicola]UXI66675.1 YdeI/OmpD-associated family protein [Tahibacter amnicola]